MDPHAPQPKRMRLGTKSCTECRRRKVRCKFDGGGDSCQQCVLHNFRCVSQDDCAVSVAASASASAPPSALSSTSDDLQARMGSLEASVRELCQAISQHGINRSSLPALSPGPKSSEREQEAQGQQDTTLDEAPLVQYLRSSLATQADASARRDNLSRQPGVGNPIILPTERRIRALIPVNSTLVNMFEFTHKLWGVWPLYTPPEKVNVHGTPNSVADAILFIDNSLRDPRPSVVAKCLTWLCLCLQQLPPGYTREEDYCLPMPKGDLMDRYLDEIDIAVLQRSSSRLGCDLDLVEVHILQVELFINMGRPCRAWKSVRQGVDTAMLLGLHRRHNNWQSVRLGVIWSTLWQLDRQVSMFLGLPYTVPNELLPPPDGGYEIGLPFEQMVMRRVAIACGRIVDRDQEQQRRKQRESLYTATVSIMESMEQIKDMIPEDWWTFKDEDQPTLNPTTAFSRRVIILHFHFANKLLHLPYVHLAARERKYEHSRFIALESAEAIVLTYLSIRSLMAETFSCDFLDFVGFSGGMVLATDLITRRGARASDEKRLWDLLNQLAEQLRSAAEELDCSVATQAAEVLFKLIDVSQCTYEGPDPYKITVPYFGTMEIKLPGLSCKDLSNWRPDSLPSDTGIVDFSADVFSFRFPNELQTAEELGQNWEDLIPKSSWDLEFRFGNPV
ncbi:unnamed protein product [Clonostachys rosea]|uniref:Zn(2)-C6 fungal-type domain-containing protein n=1 Tax=Bionectria ochroleuca TaxID=29856 RepID=A0ABY6U644_BIOOC|nr:unnamed protein product [Clonostachys rosea]